MMTKELWLKVIYSYIKHQIDPQKTIPLDHLESLNIEDISSLRESDFKYHKYTEEDIQNMLEALNDIIIQEEDREIRTENALTNLITQYPNDADLGEQIRLRYGRNN